MVQMRKLVWAKLKSPFTGTGRSGDEFANTFSSNLNVNEEYKEAFRTKSYEEMWSKVQAQLRRISVDGVDGLSSSSSLPFHVHLSDYLFEPNDHKSTLTEMADQMNFHHLLIDYFEASLDACNICDLLLRSIHQTRVNYRRIEKAIKLGKNVQDSADYTDKICGAILRELASYALLRNPLSFVSPVQFRDVHDTNLVLLHRLSSEQRKIKRKARFNRIWKKIGGYCLVISHTAILIALLVVALHGFVGIIAAPGLLSCSMCLFRKKMKTSLLEKLCGQLDLAAKGTFILINDFDTVNRLVKSLYDELEHKKALAELCVRSENPELLKEVVREFYMHDSCYQEQLDELEEHIYLCFHTINRSRRLVIQEIMVAQKK